MTARPALDECSNHLALRFSGWNLFFGAARDDAQRVIERAKVSRSTQKLFRIDAIQMAHLFDNIDALRCVQTLEKQSRALQT